MERAAFVPGAASLRPGSSGLRRQRASKCSRAPRAMLTGAALASRSYQLEEMEDSSTSTSAVFLAEDGSIQFGRTDGPEPDRAAGTWVFTEHDGALKMELERWFNEEKIPFCVRRVLYGHVDSKKSIGDLPLFQGNMFREEDTIDRKNALGHFALIEATDDLPDVNFDISKS